MTEVSHTGAFFRSASVKGISFDQRTQVIERSHWGLQRQYCCSMRTKVFVGNLNYETSLEELEAVFRPFKGYVLTKVRRYALMPVWVSWFGVC
jgi:hypothetical protein